MKTLTQNHTGADGKLNIDPSDLVKALVTMMPSDTATPKALKRKASRDPNMPKKAKTSYLFWSNVSRDAVRSKLESEAGPDVKITMGQISKELSALWKVTSDDDKAPFEAQAKAAREEYAVKKTAYEAENGIAPTVHRSTKLDSTIVPVAPTGWTGPFDGYLEKTVKDSDGKTFGKSLHTFEEAVSAAISLGAGGITRTPTGFKIRAARTVSINAASRDKNEMSWILNDTNASSHESDDLEEHVDDLEEHVDDVEETVDDVEENVEEFEHEGVTYLKDDEGNLYPDTDDNEADPIGKVNKDGTVKLY